MKLIEIKLNSCFVGNLIISESGQKVNHKTVLNYRNQFFRDCDTVIAIFREIHRRNSLDRFIK